MWDSASEGFVDAPPRCPPALKMTLTMAPWSAVAAATAFRPWFIREWCGSPERKAVATATALQGAYFYPRWRAAVRWEFVVTLFFM